jgi:hypothetical protein
MKRIKRIAVSSAATLCLATVVLMAQSASAPTAALPRLEGESLSGNKIVLPATLTARSPYWQLGFQERAAIRLASGVIAARKILAPIRDLLSIP